MTQAIHYVNVKKCKQPSTTLVPAGIMRAETDQDGAKKSSPFVIDGELNWQEF